MGRPTQTIHIETIGGQGDGIGKLNGTPVYIDGALPGEDVTAQITKGKDGVLRGVARDIKNPSSIRQTPPCPHFSECGGCAVQHMNDEAYQTWTADKVKALFAAKGVEPEVWDAPVFLPPHTRRRVHFSLYKMRGRLTFGYHQRRSNRVIDIEICLLLDPEIMALKSALEPYLANMLNDRVEYDLFVQRTDNGFDVALTGRVGAKGRPDLNVLQTVADIVRDTSVIRFSWRARPKDDVEILVEADKPYVHFGGLKVNVPPLAFLQPSRLGQDVLSQKVVEYAGEGVAKAADLFAGCGTFTGALRQNGLDVDSFEGDDLAIDALRASGHKDAYKRDLFMDPLSHVELDPYDCVVIDPPRAGAGAQCEALATSDVKRIVSVSCNPVTFARDALGLMDGSYTLKRLTIVDQFLWSPHLELVGLFEQ